MKTKVVNLRKCRTTSIIRIDRTTMFGNPFKIKKGCTRKQSIEKFKYYFYKRLVIDIPFRRKVKNLKGHLLGCWCKPLPCHGDIIVKYLENE